MNQIKTLVLMQLRDKMDLSWVKSKKDTIHTIGMSILKFLLLTLVYGAILYALSLDAIKLVYHTDMPKIMTFVMTIVLLLLVISNTVGLTKSLYYSEDNKVLITMPVSNNKIFISKLLVFFFYEVKRSFSFLVPIALACMINIFLKDYLSFWSFLWMIIPLIFIIALPVLIGALLSIPALYIARFVQRYGWTKIILLVLGLTAYVLVVMSLTKFLPEKIDMINQWPEIRLTIVDFLNAFESHNIVVTWITRMLIGEHSAAINKYVITGYTVLKTACLIGVCVVLYVLAYYISRPIFFNMMSKSFEFNKNKANKHKNRKYSKFLTFNIKEMKVCFRSAEISINYIVTFVTVPILIYFLDRLFLVMDKSSIGTFMTYAFNVLLIVFPLLMSNSLVATLYSKEGRAGYIKKTKPVNPILPLISKLSFNLVLSVPSIISCVLIFQHYVNLTAGAEPERFAAMSVLDTILLIIAIILIYYAHLFYCAKADIMNPQNEVYATSGNDVSNVNENRANVFAALLSLIYAVYAFLLFTENVSTLVPLTSMIVKLLIISIILAIIFIGGFVLNIKAFYAQSQE